MSSILDRAEMLVAKVKRDNLETGRELEELFAEVFQDDEYWEESSRGV